MRVPAEPESPRPFKSPVVFWPAFRKQDVGRRARDVEYDEDTSIRKDALWIVLQSLHSFFEKL